MMSHEQGADKSPKSLPVGTANGRCRLKTRVWGTDVTITVASPSLFTTTVPPKPDAVESSLPMTLP